MIAYDGQIPSEQSGATPTVGASGDFIAQLVNQNKELIAAIENDPKLRAQYERETAAWELNRKTTQELFSILFEEAGLLTEDEQKYRVLDISEYSSIPYRYLRAAGRTEGPRMIKNLRRLQLTDYSHPVSEQRFGKEYGYRLVHKDPHHKMSDEEKEIVHQWELRLEKFFYPPDAFEPDFNKWLGAAYEDFFDLDDITYSIRRDALNSPIGLHLEDPALIVPIIPKLISYGRLDEDLLPSLENSGEIEDPVYRYLYRKRDTREPIAALTEDFCYKSHFFVRTDFRFWRRGYSFMEQAVRITTTVMNAMTMNASNFTNNRVPPGALAITGGLTNPVMLERFKKVLWANISGAANQKKMPVIGLPQGADAKWLPFHESSKDMEFHVFMTLLLTILFSLSGTNPNEAGLANFIDALKGNRLNDDSKDGITKQSKDTGLKTFLTHLENTLNHEGKDGNIFEQLTGRPLKIRFEGLAAEDKKVKMEVNVRRLQTEASLNDLLREAGEDEQELEVAGINVYDLKGVNNQTIMQVLATKIQQAVAQQQAQAQAAAGQGQQGQSGEEQQYSDRDQQIIQQYGQPQTAGEQQHD